MFQNVSKYFIATRFCNQFHSNQPQNSIHWKMSSHLSPGCLCCSEVTDIHWGDLLIWQGWAKQTIERSPPVQWGKGVSCYAGGAATKEVDNVMTKWEPRGVRTNVYWWRSVLYTSSRRGSDYTDCRLLQPLLTPLPTFHTRFIWTISPAVPDIKKITVYFSVSPWEKDTGSNLRSEWWYKKPGETWQKMPSLACKFMLIEAQDMWEHFLLTFNKDKQTDPLLLLVNNNTFYQCLVYY